MIPGSMGDPGYLVRGKGNLSSINSAAHGAGRSMSRNEARKKITQTERNKYLKKHDVILLGGDLDEAPQAYQNIDQVMASQADLVEIVARFEPRIVRMDDGKKVRRQKSRNHKKPKQGRKQR